MKFNVKEFCCDYAQVYEKFNKLFENKNNFIELSREDNINGFNSFLELKSSKMKLVQFTNFRKYGVNEFDSFYNEIIRKNNIVKKINVTLEEDAFYDSSNLSEKKTVSKYYYINKRGFENYINNIVEIFDNNEELDGNLLMKNLFTISYGIDNGFEKYSINPVAEEFYKLCKFILYSFEVAEVTVNFVYAPKQDIIFHMDIKSTFRSEINLIKSLISSGKILESNMKIHNLLEKIVDHYIELLYKNEFKEFMELKIKKKNPLLNERKIFLSKLDVFKNDKSFKMACKFEEIEKLKNLQSTSHNYTAKEISSLSEIEKNLYSYDLYNNLNFVIYIFNIFQKIVLEKELKNSTSL